MDLKIIDGGLAAPTIGETPSDPLEGGAMAWSGGYLRRATIACVERSGLSASQLAQRLQQGGIHATEGGVMAWLEGTPPRADAMFAILMMRSPSAARLVRRLLSSN